MIGKTVFDLAPAEIADRSAAFDNALLEQPGAQIYEATWPTRRTGRYHDVLFNKATFFDPARARSRASSACMVDITQRKKLEADTRESNERLRAVIQAAPHGDHRARPATA